MSNTYFGGKSSDGHFHQIINQIPPHNTYIELFGGKLGIYRHKKTAKRTFVIEKTKPLPTTTVASDFKNSTPPLISTNTLTNQQKSKHF